ncbi:SLC13 family permease [Bergeyella sp. RCAD1439]|uniref:SLC13 family permease n=1 Tax=Bergeyella anatis TaxID=3113737 RepID=UPI002E18B357|nr:SLC13 family permease [Bergeyella sp. RCAD1439]
MGFDYFDRVRHLRTGIRVYSDLLIEKSLDVWNIKTRIGLFFFSLALSIAGAYFLSPEEFTQAQTYTLFVLFFAILLWATEAIPPFAVGIFILGFLIYTMRNIEGATVSPEVISNTWSDSVIWIFLGGFFLSEGMRKTNLDISLFKFSVSLFGNRPKFLLLGIIVVTSILSLIISNTATAAMVLASVMPLLDNEGKKSPIAKAILISIPVAATFAGMASLISSPPNLIVVDSLKSKGFDISFNDWMVLGLLPAVLLLAGFWYSVTKKYLKDTRPVDLSFLDVRIIKTKKMRLQRLFVISILLITVFFWMMGHQWHIPTSGTALIPIMFLPMLGVITAEDVRKLPWDTLMLVAGGLALGIAIKELLAPYFSTYLSSFQFNKIVMMMIFGVTTIIFSNIMSSTATATIIINIAAVVLPASQILPVALVVGLCSSCGLFLPVSTPPNAIVFGTGMLKQSDFHLGGIYGGVVGLAIAILWILFLDYFTPFTTSLIMG